MALFQPFRQVGLTALPFFAWATLVAIFIIAFEFVGYVLYRAIEYPNSTSDDVYMVSIGLFCLLVGIFLMDRAVIRWPAKALAAMFP